MDSITQERFEQLAKRYPPGEFLAGYNRRYQRGDIVEVREDSSPVTEQEQTDFYVLRVPGLVRKDAYHLQRPLRKNEERDNPVVLKRRKHFLRLQALSQSQLIQLDAGKTLNINAQSFDLLKAEKIG